jgi:hypothetical protein
VTQLTKTINKATIMKPVESHGNHVRILWLVGFMTDRQRLSETSCRRPCRCKVSSFLSLFIQMLRGSKAHCHSTLLFHLSQPHPQNTFSKISSKINPLNLLHVTKIVMISFLHTLIIYLLTRHILVIANYGICLLV